MGHRDNKELERQRKRLRQRQQEEHRCFYPLPILCPLHIRLSDARTVPRCCRLDQYEWSPDTESAVGASAGGHQAILPDWFGRSGVFSLRNDAWQPISTNHSDYGYFAGCFKYVGYLKMCHLPRGPAFIFMFSCSLEIVFVVIVSYV